MHPPIIQLRMPSVLRKMENLLYYNCTKFLIIAADEAKTTTRQDKNTRKNVNNGIRRDGEIYVWFMTQSHIFACCATCKLHPIILNTVLSDLINSGGYTVD